MERFHFDFPLGCARAPIHEAMRSCVPIAGDDWVSTHEVVLEQGENVGLHAHRQWVAIYYEEPGDPVCALMVGAERVEAARGDVVVLPPHIEHRVETSHSATPRISYAMRVSDG